MMRISALLVALLASSATVRVAVVVGDTASACDGISCGMGTCREVPPLLPFLSNVSTYACDCYPGWLNFVPLVTLTACYIPTCPRDLTCYSPTLKFPPIGSNATINPCLFMDCGPEGTCVEENNKPLRCQCKPGATNSLNDPSLPCTKGCVMGENGCPVPNPPPPPPPPPSSSSTAPPGNDHSSGPIAPSGTKGNPSSLGSLRLRSLLLLASLAALHVAW